MPSAHRRPGVGDRAALERDRPVAHRDHAAVLRTAEPHPPPPPSLTAPAAAHAHRPRHPSLPARAHLCFGVGYRHAVEQRGALVHAEHAAAELRTSATRRTLGKGAVRLPHRAQCATRNAPQAPCRNATTADPSYAACIACSMRSGPGVAPHAVQQAPSVVHQGRYHSTVLQPHGMERVHAHQITLITTHRPTYSRAPHASQTGGLSRARAAWRRATPKTKSELNNGSNPLEAIRDPGRATKRCAKQCGVRNRAPYHAMQQSVHRQATCHIKPGPIPKCGMRPAADAT